MGNSSFKNWFSENTKPTKRTPLDPRAEEEIKTEMREREARQKAERLARIERRNQRRDKSRQKLELERQKERANLKEKSRLLRNELARQRRKAQPPKQNFRGMPEFDLIIQFANRFGTDAGEDRLDKLRRLLESRGLNVRPSELRNLVKREVRRQSEKRIETMIMESNPKTYEDLIKAFVLSCDSRKPMQVAVFERLLRRFKCHPNVDRDAMANLLRQEEEKAELSTFESQLFDDSKHVSLDDLTGYSGREFEEFLKNLFSKMGHIVEITKSTGDQGADLVMTRLGVRSVVQAKRYGGKVSNKAVQEIMAAISFYEADDGIVVTNNFFTNSAVALATANKIRLIDRDELSVLINRFW